MCPRQEEKYKHIRDGHLMHNYRNMEAVSACNNHAFVRNFFDAIAQIVPHSRLRVSAFGEGEPCEHCLSTFHLKRNRIQGIADVFESLWNVLEPSKGPISNTIEMRLELHSTTLSGSANSLIEYILCKFTPIGELECDDDIIFQGCKCAKCQSVTEGNEKHDLACLRVVTLGRSLLGLLSLLPAQILTEHSDIDFDFDIFLYDKNEKTEYPTFASGMTSTRLDLSPVITSSGVFSIACVHADTFTLPHPTPVIVNEPASIRSPVRTTAEPVCGGSGLPVVDIVSPNVIVEDPPLPLLSSRSGNVIGFYDEDTSDASDSSAQSRPTTVLASEREFASQSQKVLTMSLVEFLSQCSASQDCNLDMFSKSDSAVSVDGFESFLNDMIKPNLVAS